MPQKEICNSQVISTYCNEQSCPVFLWTKELKKKKFENISKNLAYYYNLFRFDWNTVLIVLNKQLDNVIVTSIACPHKSSPILNLIFIITSHFHKYTNCKLPGHCQFSSWNQSLLILKHLTLVDSHLSDTIQTPSVTRLSFMNTSVI